MVGLFFLLAKWITLKSYILEKLNHESQFLGWRCISLDWMSQQCSFVGVSAFVHCLPSHPFLEIRLYWPCRLSGQVMLICRVQWQNLYVQLIEIGKRAEGQQLLSPAELWAELLLLLPGWTSVHGTGLPAAQPAWFLPLALCCHCLWPPAAT